MPENEKLVERLRAHVIQRGGPAKDGSGQPVMPNGAWQMMLEAAAALTAPPASPARDDAEAAQAEIKTLKALICRIEPYVDAIVCYASTMGEHEPNRIAHEVRAVCYGPSQDELVGQQIAARMIAKIDAATKKTGVERAWLIELKGTSPSWAIVNPNDYDEHWTTDSTRALRFARKVDAEAYIAHIGWTEAFASEHIWDDGRGNHHAL